MPIPKYSINVSSRGRKETYDIQGDGFHSWVSPSGSFEEFVNTYCIHLLLRNLIFFVNKSSPIIMITEAFDYGADAYIYQLIDNVEQPIIYISKPLHGDEPIWSTV